jgi:hypothetical protein
MSRSWPMLMLRNRTYYYHRTVPKRLRPLLAGKGQIWKSLRTSDLDVAKLRSLEEGQRIERMFQSLSRRADTAQSGMKHSMRGAEVKAKVGLLAKPGATVAPGRGSVAPRACPV